METTLAYNKSEDLWAGFAVSLVEFARKPDQRNWIEDGRTCRDGFYMKNSRQFGEEGTPWFYRMDEQGETPLSRTFKTSYPYLIDLVLNQAERYVAARDTKGNVSDYWGMAGTAAKLTAGKRSKARIERLIEATRNGNLESVRSLVERGCDLRAADANGLSALHWAALSGQIEAAEYLLDHGAEINPPLPESKLSPAGIALLMGYSELFEMLLMRGGRPV